MNRTELAELIRNGGSSGVEFKRAGVRPERLAREIAALLNHEGGHVLLGVEDDGAVTGLALPPKRTEEWVMEVARVHVRPAAVPWWETIDWDGRRVGVVSLPADAPDKPYKAKRGSAWVTQVRVGTTTRDATDEEEARLYMQAGRIPYDRRPVSGASFDDLDLRRLVNYFRDLRRQHCPPAGDRDARTRLLVNSELMAEDRGRVVPSAAGLLLFGARPNRRLPQAGVSAAAYAGVERTTTPRPAPRCAARWSRSIRRRRPTSTARIPGCRRRSRTTAGPSNPASSKAPSTSCAATPRSPPGSTTGAAGASAGTIRWRRCARRSSTPPRTATTRSR